MEGFTIFYCFTSKKVVKRLITSKNENTTSTQFEMHGFASIYSTNLKCSLILKRFALNLGEVPPRKIVPSNSVFLDRNEM